MNYINRLVLQIIQVKTNKNQHCQVWNQDIFCVQDKIILGNKSSVNVYLFLL